MSKDAHVDMRVTLGPTGVSYSTVKKWRAKHRTGAIRVLFEPWSKRQKKATDCMNGEPGIENGM